MPSSNGETRTILCPYCGHMQNGGNRCDLCGGLFEPLSRKATQIAMGPWYLRDPRVPFRPGCSYEVIKRQAKAGKIKSTTIMRGPTTKQFWSVARNVPGVAHLIGYCHECSEKVDPSSPTCPHCGATFSEPNERNELGLMFTNEAEASRAQRRLNAVIARATGKGGDDVGDIDDAADAKGGKAGAGSAGGGDLLSDVLGVDVDIDLSAPKGKATPAAPAVRGGHVAATHTLESKVTADSAASIAALDFAPSDDDAPLGNVDELANLDKTTSRLGAMTWVLVGVNVLILLAVIYMFFIVAKRSQDNAPSTDNGASSRSKDTSGSAKARAVEPFVLAADDPVSLAIQSPPPTISTVIAPDTQASSKVESFTDPDDAARLAAQQAALAKAEADRRQHNQVAALVNQAEKRRGEGDLRGALAALESIQKDFSQEYHPRLLVRWINQTRDAIEGKPNSSATFFGVGGN